MPEHRLPKMERQDPEIPFSRVRVHISLHHTSTVLHCVTPSYTSMRPQLHPTHIGLAVGLSLFLLVGWFLTSSSHSIVHDAIVHEAGNIKQQITDSRPSPHLKAPCNPFQLPGFIDGNDDWIPMDASCPVVTHADHEALLPHLLYPSSIPPLSLLYPSSTPPLPLLYPSSIPPLPLLYPSSIPPLSFSSLLYPSFPLPALSDSISPLYLSIFPLRSLYIPSMSLPR